MAKEMMNSACVTSLFTLRKDFLHDIKSYSMGPAVLLPLRRKGLCGFFYLPLKSITSSEFEPVNLGPNVKRSNH
jgi:hypothetical protein